MKNTENNNPEKSILIAVNAQKKHNLIFSEQHDDHRHFLGLASTHPKLKGKYLFYCSCIWHEFETQKDTAEMTDVDVANRTLEVFDVFAQFLSQGNDFARCYGCHRVGHKGCYAHFKDDAGHVFCTGVCMKNCRVDESSDLPEEEIVEEMEDMDIELTEDEKKLLKKKAPASPKVETAALTGYLCKTTRCGIFCKYNGVMRPLPATERDRNAAKTMIKCKICNRDMHTECHGYNYFDDDKCNDNQMITSLFVDMKMTAVCNTIDCLTAAMKLMATEMTWQQFTGTKKTVGQDVFKSVNRLIDLRCELVDANM